MEENNISDKANAMLKEIISKLPEDDKGRGKAIAVLAGVSGGYSNIADTILKKTEDIINSESNDKYDDILLLLRDHQTRSKNMFSIFSALMVSAMIKDLEKDESTDN